MTHDNEDIQLIYISERCTNTDDTEIHKIQLRAEHQNHRRNITGALLYTDKYFLQYIEGHAPVVDALFASISRDPRHTNVRVLLRAPIQHRDFSRWSLGVKKLLDSDEYQDFNSVLNMLGDASKVNQSQLDWFKLAMR